MPQGDSLSERKLFLPEPKPRKTKRRKARRRKRRRKNRTIQVLPQNLVQESSLVEEIGNLDKSSVVKEVGHHESNKNEDIDKTEVFPSASMVHSNTIVEPRELTVHHGEEATEKIAMDKDEECTEVVSPNFYQETDPNCELITEPLEITEDMKTDIFTLEQHKKELKHLFLFGFSMFCFGLLPYSSSAFAELRPWNQGEPLPLLSLLYSNQQVVEDAQGNLEIATLPPNDPLMNSTEEVFEEMDSERRWAAMGTIGGLAAR